MIKRFFFVIIFIPFFVFSQEKNNPYSKGEYLKYKISFGPIVAGYGELSVSDIKKRKGKNLYHMIGKGRTAPFFDWFFKVRDTYETYIDAISNNPVFFNRDVYEGGHVIKQKYNFNHKNKKVDTGEKNYFISDTTQDMLSAYYYARGLDKNEIEKDSVFSINIFMDEEIYILEVKYLYNEIINTNYGKLNCLVFQPKMQKGRVFAAEEKMKVWISDDNNRILVKVETDIWAGKIIAKITEIKNTKYPLKTTN